MIPKYNYMKTFNMDANAIIDYLKNVYDDANTSGDKGYLNTYLQSEDEIMGRLKMMAPNRYKIANELIENINNSLSDNFEDSELENMIN
jgi:hypothetical protein